MRRDTVNLIFSVIQKSMIENMEITVITVKTEPIPGQNPGTSGLRKKTTVFEAESFVWIELCISLNESSHLTVSLTLSDTEGWKLSPKLCAVFFQCSGV